MGAFFLAVSLRQDLQCIISAIMDLPSLRLQVGSWL
jgi:hypothetical protein